MTFDVIADENDRPVAQSTQLSRHTLTPRADCWPTLRDRRHSAYVITATICSQPWPSTIRRQKWSSKARNRTIISGEQLGNYDLVRVELSAWHCVYHHSAPTRELPNCGHATHSNSLAPHTNYTLRETEQHNTRKISS